MKKEKMSKLNEWGKDKPLGLVMMAEQLAIGAEDCFEFLTFVKAGERIEDLAPLLKTTEWVLLYRSHRRMQRVIIEELRRFGGMGELLVDAVEVFLSRGRKKKEFERTLESIWKMRAGKREKLIGEAEKEIDRLHLADIESGVNSEDKGELEELRKTLERPEIFFYLRVWVPCWFLYRDFPPRMLRAARLGDVTRMKKLLRLDTRVLNDSKINEYFHEAKRKSKKRTLDSLTEALRKGPKGKITFKKIKCRLAGLISSLSILQGHKLEEPEIRTLFDAVAHDMGRGDIDTDLPESPEAFAKALQRERAFWMPTLRPDKK